MLIVRQEQIDAFTENNLLDHIRLRLPDQFRALGEENTRHAVRYGMSRARAYGLDSDPSMRVYVQIMFILGPDFDIHPEMPWARQALSADTEYQRVQSLVAGAHAHLQRRADRER